MLIAITGGIGSGKSVVSRILASMGYEVYDTDSRAKMLMDQSDAVKERLVRHFGENVVVDGKINRPLLSSIVFGDTEKLRQLNTIVHHLVINDINCNFARNECERPKFVETAILYQSGLDKYVDAVWEVTAPESVRVVRVMRRNGLTAEQVSARIASQQHTPRYPLPEVHQLVNDNRQPLLPQILKLISQIVD